MPMGRSPFSTTPLLAGVGHGGAQLLVEVELGEEEQAELVVVGGGFGGQLVQVLAGCGTRRATG